MQLSNRLKSLRKQHNLTQQNVADHLNIKRSTYAKYETGENQPDPYTLNQLADFYNVSVDYLLGRTDIPNPPIKDIFEGLSNEQIELIYNLISLFKKDKQ